MDDLRPSMNAAVGATGAGDRRRLGSDAAQRRLERILYGAAARLRLPAEKATAVVLQS
jgi:hypothetical protein